MHIGLCIKIALTALLILPIPIFGAWVTSDNNKGAAFAFFMYWAIACIGIIPPCLLVLIWEAV